MNDLKEKDNCIICLESDDEDLYKCYNCVAKYHKNCISRWLNINEICTLCRKSLDILDVDDQDLVIGGNSYIFMDSDLIKNLLNLKFPSFESNNFKIKIANILFSTLNLAELVLFLTLIVKAKNI